jgi:hypothetical protein
VKVRFFIWAIFRCKKSAKSPPPFFPSGGTGKSEVIKAVDLFHRIRYGQTPAGSCGSSLLTAPTGNSAVNINGDTWQGGLGHNRASLPLKKFDDTLYPRPSDQEARGMQKRCAGLRIFILDEMSMVGLISFWQIHLRLNWSRGFVLENEMKDFGGYKVGIFGDLFQLRNVGGGAPLYTPLQDLQRNLSACERNFRQSKSRENQNSLNAAKICCAARELWMRIDKYVELVENFRFVTAQGAPPNLLAPIVSRARIGVVTREDCNVLNRQRCDSIEEASKCFNFPHNARCAASTHRVVNKLNAADFQAQCAAGNTLLDVWALHGKIKLKNKPVDKSDHKTLRVARTVKTPPN